MALIDELKQQRAEMDEKYHRAIADGSYYCGRLNDLDTAIAALESPAQPVHPDELRDAPPAASEESGDHIPQTIATLNAMDNPDRVSDDFTLLDRAVLRDEPDEVEAEPEGYAPVVDAEAVLDATELAQVTIDKVPPTAEVIKDQTGRAKFALFGGQTHEVVEPSNTEADFWARVLHPRKREEA